MYSDVDNMGIDLYGDEMATSESAIMDEFGNLVDEDHVAQSFNDDEDDEE